MYREGEFAGRKDSRSARHEVQTPSMLEEMEVRGMWFDDDDEGSPNFTRIDAIDALSGKNLSWKQRFRDLLEGQPHAKDKYLHIGFNIVSLVVILISIVVFCIETLPQYIKSSDVGTTPFNILEYFCITFFVLEIFLRVYCVPWHFLKNPFFAVDVIAVLGFMLDVGLDAGGANSSGAQGASFLRSFRLIRIFRVFKLSRHSKSLQLVFLVMKNSFSGLTSLLLPIVMILVVGSTFIYFFEVTRCNWNEQKRLWLRSNGQPSQFQSIPDAIWYAVTTITTVGYGDIIPLSSEGRVIGVLLAFSGVLILSFPNIVLGGNLQLAFRIHYKMQSRRMLGRKFRKIINLLHFIRSLRERAEERRLEREEMSLLAASEATNVAVEGPCEDRPALPGAVQDAAAARSVNRLVVPPAPFGALSPSNTKKMFYMMTKGEVELYRDEDVPPIDNDNIRSWSHCEISAVEWLQRLLELCSGVGTTEELATSFSTDKSPIPSPADVALIGLYLMESDYVQVFAFRRQAVNMLFCLTPLAVQELLLHKEDCHAECIRGVEMAKVVWRQTTGQSATFVLQPLQATYQQWACAERMADNALYTPEVNLKSAFLGKGKRNSARRTSSFADRRRSTVQDVISRETAKTRMRTILEQQQQFIAKLQADIAQLEQHVAAGYGL